MNLICFSHLRWNFVFQRPQHLLSRFAKQDRVYYFEEPIFDNNANDSYTIKPSAQNVWVVTPYLKVSNGDIISRQKKIIDHLILTQNIIDYSCWYYSPMFLPFTRHLTPSMVIYDCMDELSAFKFAPEELKKLEKELFNKADIVFTGGNSLFEAKKSQHRNIYPFPSSIDRKHFSKARLKSITTPVDQDKIAFPRIGFCGVIDERFDIDLIKEIADKKPGWQIVLIGPVVKIDPATLPKNSNIHYLGSKSYDELPSYINGWQLSMIPFAINDATRYISPTKTPEYLAAGKPVISTAIRDVVHPFGTNKLVSIINTADEFIEAAQDELNKKPQQRKAWLENVDAFLANNSWDNTWEAMVSLMKQTIANKTARAPIIPLEYENILSA